MSDHYKIKERLQQVKNFLTPDDSTATSIPFNPDSTKFPTRKELPKIPDAPEGAAWVWGKDDGLGRLNLLTPMRVKAAASSEIRTGEMVSLNLPLDVPKVPGFHREQFQHEIKTLLENIAYDDKFKPFSHIPSLTFYNGVKGSEIQGSNQTLRDSIHHWSNHGIAGRGILLDYYSYAQANGISYPHFKTYGITYEELVKCGKSHGIDIRPESQGGDIKIGDLLFIRTGFVDAYYKTDPAEWAKVAIRAMDDPVDPQSWAGVQQEEAMVDWLHDCWFAVVAGDQPSFESWPTKQEYHLHEYLLALWGCPIGEMFDLEALSKKCQEHKRWTFFVTSSPANCIGGVSSHGNALAFF
ncbi:MAG: hypothetical protein MMC33_008895 [Icmadophila ericetorum]|nr:hypothetical protein [Icmadophila ericetorum]